MKEIRQRIFAARNRSRLKCVLIAGVFIVSGLLSRKFDRMLPGLLHKNTGDLLWALVVYSLFCAMLPRRSIAILFASSTLFAGAIEFSKYYHSFWLDPIRATILGRLIFGWGFSWKNLLCYIIGNLLCAGFEMASTREHKE